jgi:hypothetical protein
LREPRPASASPPASPAAAAPLAIAGVFSLLARDFAVDFVVPLDERELERLLDDEFPFEDVVLFRRFDALFVWAMRLSLVVMHLVVVLPAPLSKKNAGRSAWFGSCTEMGSGGRRTSVRSSLSWQRFTVILR